MASKENPSVIIADNYMPDGDARYLLHRLRSSTATENIPVFVISGKPLDEVTEQTLRREIGGRPGAAQIFKKSFDTEVLFGALKKLCAFEIQKRENFERPDRRRQRLMPRRAKSRPAGKFHHRRRKRHGRRRGWLSVTRRAGKPRQDIHTQLMTRPSTTGRKRAPFGAPCGHLLQPRRPGNLTPKHSPSMRFDNT